MTKILYLTFSVWQLCEVDQQERGTLPAYVFHLMTIYYLQRCDPPVLPVMHEVGVQVFHSSVYSGLNKMAAIFQMTFSNVELVWLPE